MNLITLLPAQYAKFIASLVGNLLVYLQLYGATWHLVPAMTAVAVSLGVMGVPNASKPAPAPALPAAVPQVPAAAPIRTPVAPPL